MGAGIVQGEGMPVLIAAEHQGNFEQRGFMQAIAELAAGQGTVPEAVQHDRIGRLALGGIELAHRDKAAYYSSASRIKRALSAWCPEVSSWASF
jgi:hypothetical protein